MTVSKVSEERETDTVVEVYPAEQLLDQPTEQADDNNNTSATEQQPSEMKYELKTPSPSLPSRSPRRSRQSLDWVPRVVVYAMWSRVLQLRMIRCWAI